jgi:carbon-monoxide dehydrogenase large subunit
MTAAFKGRREDLRLVTGQGKYTSDWNFPGQLYGHFLRSDRAHAEIVSLEAGPARSAPGVAAVFTGADTAKAGFKSTPNIARYPGRGGATIKVPHRDGLANGRVRFVGQEVALVVASTAQAAQDAAESIEVEYRDLPVVVDAESALAAGAEQLYPDIPGNLCFDYEYGDEAKTAEAFSRAAHVTRIALDSQRMVGNPMEPKACLAVYDAGADVYDLYTSSQGLSLMRGSASGITGIPPEKIRVHAHDVGGGFGIRSDAYAEYCVAMLAAKALGRPVKWTSTRSETFVSDYHGRAAKLLGELALDRDGKFLAIRINWIVNMGAYLSTPRAHQHPAAGAARDQPVPHPRDVPDATACVTNTTPTTAYRGAGVPTCATSPSASSRRRRAR